MKYIGAHVSASGGVENAPLNANMIGAKAFALFTKNQKQWFANALSKASIKAFRENCEKHDYKPFQILPHDSYLINLASPDDVLWRKSIEAFKHELERAEALELIGVVMHPGAYTSSTPEAGLQRIVEALDEIHAATAGFKTLTLLCKKRCTAFSPLNKCFRWWRQPKPKALSLSMPT